MCLCCTAGSSQPSAGRRQILDLLALIEHPDALPAEAALRIAAEILAWVEPERSRYRCDLAHARITDRTCNVGGGVGDHKPANWFPAGASDDLLAELEGIYRDIHANPELSMQEHRTAGIAAGVVA